MIKLRECHATGAFVVGLTLLAAVARAALPDYRLGEVATADVITTIRLSVVNPDATEAEKQKAGRKVLPVIRRLVPATAEAETELRTSVAITRKNFLAALQRALSGRVPSATDVNSAAYNNTIRELAPESPENFPFARLAPWWLRGASDDALVENLLEPLREVMAQPIVTDEAENPAVSGQSVRLIQVGSLLDLPGLHELETTGATISSDKLSNLVWAHRVVETYFPSGQEDLGKFAATFVRANAYPAPGLTEILRAKRMDAVSVNDVYEAGQAIVKKGRTIDQKTLNALTALREKNLIGALQMKTEQDRSVGIRRIGQQMKWIAVGFVVTCLTLILLLRRVGAASRTALVPLATQPRAPGLEPRVWPDGSASEAGWRSRALIAEFKLERAHEAIRRGALGWMREKFFHTLFSQRSELLSTQQRAENEIRELERRLEQLLTPLQGRIAAYEKRIQELEEALAAKDDENRELIGARITVTKQQLQLERGRFGSN
jgi:hypothetical protein